MKANLAPGSSRSFTEILSLSVMCLQRSSRENIYGDSVWDNDTKSISDIVLFLRDSSSCMQPFNLVGRPTHKTTTTLSLRRGQRQDQKETKGGTSVPLQILNIPNVRFIISSSVRYLILCQFYIQSIVSFISNARHYFAFHSLPEPCQIKIYSDPVNPWPTHFYFKKTHNFLLIVKSLDFSSSVLSLRVFCWSFFFQFSI